MTVFQRFFASMAGRMFVVLVLGVALSTGVAFGVAAVNRRAELERLHLDRAADRVANYVQVLSDSDEGMARVLRTAGLPGVRFARPEATSTEPDPELTRLLTQRMGAAAAPVAAKAPIESCRRPQRGGRGGLSPQQQSNIRDLLEARDRQGEIVRAADCWLVSLKMADGTPARLAIDMPPRRLDAPRRIDPAFLFILALGAAVLAYFVSHLATAPLNKLALAAEELGENLDRSPLHEDGPVEVSAAARAFNAMQARLRKTLAERTHMLAAITHDLQTPVTRLRLRLEKVEDEELRERLISDLAAMQALIREGLDLARSHDITEPFATLDLDSLLESLVEDEADAGRKTSFTARCGCDVKVRPQALSRTVTNLIDNAIQYGGSAEVSAQKVGGDVVIRVRDRGPGIPDSQLEAVFEPLYRLETSRSRETGGAGLGLTIARMLAQKNGATLTMRNHPEGGAEAVLTLKGQG